MLYVVYINNEGFIEAFNKIDSSYRTVLNIEDADYSSSLEDAESIAEYYNGTVLQFEEDE